MEACPCLKSQTFVMSFYHLTCISVHSVCHSAFYFDYISYSFDLYTCFQPFQSVLPDHYIVYQGLFLCVQVDVDDLWMFTFYSQVPLLFD